MHIKLTDLKILLQQLQKISSSMVKSADSEFPDWLLTKDVWDTEDYDSRPAEPYASISDAPVLLIIYFLRPRFKGKKRRPFYSL